MANGSLDLIEEMNTDDSNPQLNDNDISGTIRVFQQRLRESRREIEKLNSELQSTKLECTENLKKLELELRDKSAELKTEQQNGIRLIQSLEAANKQIKVIEKQQNLNKPENIVRLIKENEQVKMELREKSNELERVKNNLSSLEKEYGIERSKVLFMSNELDTKNEVVKDLKERLGGVRSYARSQIWELMSELSLSKNGQTEETIPELPEFLRAPPECEKLRGLIRGLNNTVELQHNQQIEQKKVYDKLLRDYTALKDASKNSSYAELVNQYQKMKREKETEVRNLQRELVHTGFENKRLRKVLDSHEFS